MYEMSSLITDAKNALKKFSLKIPGFFFLKIDVSMFSIEQLTLGNS